jgi:hypothetical protein
MERSYRNGVDWRDLCEQASKEQDPEKLIEVVQRLNEALEERRRRPVQRPFAKVVVEISKPRLKLSIL